MAAPTIVQSNATFSLSVSSGAAVSITMTSAITAGNMVLVLVGTAHDSTGAAITINSPTMTGETFTVWTGAPNAGTASNGQTGVFATNSAAGGQTVLNVTVTYTGTGTKPDVHLHVIEINGQAASPRDAQGNTESATMSVSTSGATATATDLIIGFFYDDALSRTLVAGSGYTQVRFSNDTTNGDCGLSESKTVAATGVQTATATGNSTDIVEQSIVAIAGTAGGGGGTVMVQGLPVFWMN